MTNPSTHAHNAQNQNPSSEYLAIDFSHRLPTLKKDDISFIDAIDHFAYRAISILEVMQKADFEVYDALGTAISEIQDIRSVAKIYCELFTKNTNPQT